VVITSIPGLRRDNLPVPDGNTINLMTLGGLALATGILRTTTVAVENIHQPPWQALPAILTGPNEVALPRTMRRSLSVS
jgi:hypothetical protein